MKNKNIFCTQNLGPPLVGGLDNDLIGLGLRPALVTPEYSRKLVSVVTQKLERRSDGTLAISSSRERHHRKPTK